MIGPDTWLWTLVPETRKKKWHRHIIVNFGQTTEHAEKRGITNNKYIKNNENIQTYSAVLYFKTIKMNAYSYQ